MTELLYVMPNQCREKKATNDGTIYFCLLDKKHKGPCSFLCDSLT